MYLEIQKKKTIQMNQIIHRLRIKILGWLLHHANREYHSEIFYKIKKIILSKYGVSDGEDVQFIAGKHCFRCGGSGVYSDYYDSGEQWADTCRHCCHGWYKLPVHVILEKKKLSRYTFHQPVRRVYNTKEAQALPPASIEGYVQHSYSKYGKKARTVLFLMYDWDGFWKRWKRDIGFGWRICWWKPSNWVNNIAHLIKKGKDAHPVKNFTEKYFQKPVENTINDLPF